MDQTDRPTEQRNKIANKPATKKKKNASNQRNNKTVIDILSDNAAFSLPTHPAPRAAGYGGGGLIDQNTPLIRMI